MKLQLLLVLAVAALVPSLSEGRVFSKCELKTIFQTAIKLPGKHQKLKEEVLAAIICQLNATSGLNSNLVTVEGIRESSTTAQPSTLAPTGSPIEPVKQTTNPPTSTAQTTNPPTSTAQTTNPPTDTTQTTNPPTDTTQTTNPPTDTTQTTNPPTDTTQTTIMPDTTTLTTIAPTTTTPTNATAAVVTTAGLASPSSSTPSGIRRRKRSSSRQSENQGKPSEEPVFDVKWKCDMKEIQKDDNGKGKHNSGNSESSEEDQETTDWSLGKYGIFQLTDGHFCDSGYRRSRNVCHTDCSAFTDDDISDDIECVLESKYLGCIMKQIPQFCKDQAKTYFSDCS